jgi:hypothetical protein
MNNIIYLYMYMFTKTNMIYKYYIHVLSLFRNFLQEPRDIESGA